MKIHQLDHKLEGGDTISEQLHDKQHFYVNLKCGFKDIIATYCENYYTILAKCLYFFNVNDGVL
jgi:hypothetical protein